MAVYPIRKYGLVIDVPDDARDGLVTALRFDAVNLWRSQIAALRYQPVGEPAAELHHAVIPRRIDDPDGRASIKLPDRQWRVVGRVVSDAVPGPIADFPHSHIEIPKDAD